MAKENGDDGMFVLVKEKELTPRERILKWIKELPSKLFNGIQTIVIVLAILVVVYLILITPHQVDGISMHPTYVNGELLLANKALYNFRSPGKGDVVIFKFSETRDFIKRVIATQGDTVRIEDGRISVNGVVIDESTYLDRSVYTKGGAYLKEGQTVIIPDGMVFVLGDNRDHSSDSRTFGPIEASKIKGKVMIVFYPISSLRIITNPNY